MFYYVSNSPSPDLAAFGYSTTMPHTSNHHCGKSLTYQENALILTKNFASRKLCKYVDYLKYADAFLRSNVVTKIFGHPTEN
jgi:hypothetical protein